MLRAQGSGAQCRNGSELELQNRGKLQASRATASEERIPSAHVAGGGERVICGSSAEDVPAQRAIGCANIPNKIRPQRIREIRMAKDVEEFSPQLEIHALTAARVLKDVEVEFLEARPFQGIPSEIAEVTHSGNAIGLVRRTVAGRTPPCARSSESSKIQVLARAMRRVLNGANHIGTIEALARPAVVAPEFVIQSAKAGHPEDSGFHPGPSAREFGRTIEFWRGVSEVPREPDACSEGAPSRKGWSKP